MANFDQPISTYDDTGYKRRVLSDVVKMIDPLDTPLIAALGGLDGGRSKFKVNINGTKVELLEDTLDPLSSTANHTTTIATDATNFPVADASIFRDGQVILIDSEYMVVKTPDVTNNTIIVYARDFGGTNATHLSTSAIEIVGMARLEGDQTDYSIITAMTQPYNYTAIFQDAVVITGTEGVIDEYGVGSQYEYQSMKKMPRLLQLVDKALYHGVRAIGTKTAPRSMGGLPVFITDNTVTASSGAITKTILDNLLENIYLDGGNPDLLVVNPKSARDLRDIMDNSNYIKTDMSNQQMGMKALTMVQTQFNQMRLVMDRFCPVSTAYVLDSSRIGLYTLRPFAWRPLGVDGDRDRAEVVGEVTLLVANDSAHGKITTIST